MATPRVSPFYYPDAESSRLRHWLCSVPGAQSWDGLRSLYLVYRSTSRSSSSYVLYAGLSFLPCGFSEAIRLHPCSPAQDHLPVDCCTRHEPHKGVKDEEVTMQQRSPQARTIEWPPSRYY